MHVIHRLSVALVMCKSYSISLFSLPLSLTCQCKLHEGLYFCLHSSCDSSRVDSYRYAYRWNTECIQPMVCQPTQFPLCDEVIVSQSFRFEAIDWSLSSIDRLKGPARAFFRSSSCFNAFQLSVSCNFTYDDDDDDDDVQWFNVHLKAD